MNKFENGLEHVKLRISNIEDEIYNITELRERNIIEKEKLEDEIYEIIEIEKILSELYDELYRISNFHEANNVLITRAFEEKLVKIFKDYYSNKLENLNNINFLDYEQIKYSYQNSRLSLINELKANFGQDLLNIEVLNNIIKKLIESNEKIFYAIFKVEDLYKILLCFIYTDFLIWDPFSDSQNTDLLSFSSIINDVLKQDGVTTLNVSFFNTEKLVEKLYLEKLMNYICEIVKLYWTPFYFKETENFVKSIRNVKDILEIDMAEVVSELMKKLQDNFNFLISENFLKPENEFKFVLLILNWAASVLMVTKAFEVKQEYINLLISKSILHFSQNSIQNHENKNLKKLLCETEIDVEEINNYSVNEQKLDSSILLNPKVVGLLNINEALYQIKNSFKLNIPKKKYILIDIILEIISNYN
ncbi:unnamed protein product [Cryptosporidium hominis]|uniref:Uncharacterized protein n=1 Tax=Cryptosporidium hominis TaxID=237895 RepID=A0A0S4TFS5_CRYHO|nr:hypothetical protein [Cryptosporidium hominis TU502]PPS96797.1 Uncharacterized protein GY17_00001559 [Cryptosporidium hominis]CUV06354.1 unnamed protein product [Cryptosporidium hominis]|eukprot:PPS96797.1 Uncharacterized protein GY17_00001559 [Cryptosporidium hominis]